MITSYILDFDKGPSSSRLDQIPSFKVIYVCFLMPESGKFIFSELLQLDPFQSQQQNKKSKKNEEVFLHSWVKSIAPILVPKSLSIVGILKVGRSSNL